MVELFFETLSALFAKLDLPPCDIWVAGSYARGEQKAQLVGDRISSASDLEMLVVAGSPYRVRAALRKATPEISKVIDSFFNRDPALDFDYWVVGAHRFVNQPCLLFHDAVLARKRIHTGLRCILKPDTNRHLMRDLREILIHRAANQVLSKNGMANGPQGTSDGSVVARNILDLLTVHFYARSVYLPSYTSRLAAIDDTTRATFGADSDTVFSRCLRIKLGIECANNLSSAEIKEFEAFFVEGIVKLDMQTQYIQRATFGEDSLNYSGPRVIIHRLRHLTRRPSAMAIRTLFMSKQQLLSTLIKELETDRMTLCRSQTAEQIRFLISALLANYPYLERKIAPYI